jgi:hypothetical protein
MCQEKMVFKMINSGDAIPDDLLNAVVSQVGIKFGVPTNIGHASCGSDRYKGTTVHLSCLARR